MKRGFIEDIPYESIIFPKKSFCIAVFEGALAGNGNVPEEELMKLVRTSMAGTFFTDYQQIRWKHNKYWRMFERETNESKLGYEIGDIETIYINTTWQAVKAYTFCKNGKVEYLRYFDVIP